MSRKYNLSIDHDELGLLVEAVEILRLHQQGFREQENGRVKLYWVKRLENRLKRRLEKAALNNPPPARDLLVELDGEGER